MQWRRRTTYVVEATGAGALDPASVHGFYAAVLGALRGEAGRVVLDLLPRTEPLPPAAKDAALTLQRLTRSDLFATVDRNPFQHVTIDHADDEQWRALLLVAPFAPDLRLEGEALFSDLFSSEGTLGSVRLRVRPEQLLRVQEGLASVPEVDARVELRPRRGRGRSAGRRRSRWM